MYKSLFLFLLSAFFVGCYTTTQAVSVENRSRTYDTSVHAVFEAARQTLIVGGYPIDHVDRDNGLITTGVRYDPDVPGGRIRANLYVDEVARGQTRLTLLLSAEDMNTKGRIYAEQMLRRTARGLYQDLLDEIEMRL